MNKSYFLILTVSALMLMSFFSHQDRKLSFGKARRPTPKVIKSKYQELKKASQTPKNKQTKQTTALYYALMTGDKRYLDKDTRRSFQQMGLMHLLTPSGLHLSSLVVITKCIPLHWQLLFMLVICVGFSLLEDYFAIKRVIIFKIITLLLRVFFPKKIKDPNQYAFLLTFVIDLMLGNFQHSPLSYIYSFLFWGTILFHSGSIYQLSYKLFINLSVTAVIACQAITLTSLLLNTPISILFSLVYPLLFCNFWMPLSTLQTDFSLSMLEVFYKFIHITSTLLPTFIPTVLFITLLFLIPSNFSNKKILLTLLLVIICPQAPMKKYNFSNNKYIWSMTGENKCKKILREYYYEIKCKKGGQMPPNI